MWILLSAVGTVIGAVAGDGPGALLGGVCGGLLGLVHGAERREKALRKRVEQLETTVTIRGEQLADVHREVQALNTRLDGLTVAHPEHADGSASLGAPSAAPDPSDGEASAEAPAPPPERAASRSSAAPTVAARTSEPTAPVSPGAAGGESTSTPPTGTPIVRDPAASPIAAAGSAVPAAPPRPSAVDEAIGFVRELVLGGNTVVRVGILVLLVGVTLLLKHAADNHMFPLEMRMVTAGLLGMALVMFGLRQREARPGFARTLQGGGVAAMYLVVFFSYRTYELLPAGLALALLVALAVGSSVLAVAQDALGLIAIGQIGGFLAPILASSGSGNHVALFSYYLVLNLAIFGIAFVRAWRPLNLIGFVFTFGIGTAWGALDYEPDKLASTEPFLIAFFLMYVAIPVIFALRHQTRGWVDGSLVFGAPLAFLALQLSLVSDIPFAMAYTTLALAVLYLGLTRFLQRRAPETLRAMSEAFLALGFGFGTLAVPYGLDNAGLTGATWALEGAGLYFLGVRQLRWVSRAAGVVLQGLGGMALVYHLFSSPTSDMPVVNTRTLGAAFIAFGSLFVARHAYRHRRALPRLEASGLQLLIGWALLFWLPAGIAEINDHVAYDLQPGASVAFLGATGMALELPGRRLAFTPGRYAAAVLIPLLLPIMLLFELDVEDHLLSHGGALGFPIYLAACVLSLRRLVPPPRPASEDSPAPAPPLRAFLHPLFLWSLAGFLSLLSLRLVRDEAGLAGDWPLAAVGLCPVALTWLSLRGADTSRWPFKPWADMYVGLGAGVLACGTLLWTLLANLRARGASEPLPYFPLFNPIDLSLLLGFVVLIAWYVRARRDPPRSWPADISGALPAALAGFLFLWFNGMLARSVHQYTDVPFERDALWRSVPLQVAFSVSWTVLALAITIHASRRAQRVLWMVGATLLGVVVFKLFLVDLDRLSTVAKIGTFLVVGVLLLAVGYFAPVPPRSASASTPAPDSEGQDPSTSPKAGDEVAP